MAEMVGAGVMEGLQPDTRHGVEAQLALEGTTSIPNVVDHRLDLTQEHPHTDSDIHTHPHVVHDQAQKDAAQLVPLIKPTTLDPVEANVLHHDDVHHDVEGAGALLVDPLVHEGHQAHTAQPGHTIHGNRPGSADPMFGVQPGADTGVVEPTLPDSVNMPSGLNAEKHNDVHLRNQQELAAGHDGVFGNHGAVLPQTAGYGGVLSQLLSFGVPVACVFAAVAFVLWKRIGPSRPLTSSV